MSRSASAAGCRADRGAYLVPLLQHVPHDRKYRARERALAAIWLVLFAVYARTLGLDSFGSSDYGGDEPHYLLTAKSLVDDGDFDVRNQRADRDWEEFYPYFLDRHGKLTEGHAHEPHGAGFPALIAPRVRARRREGRRALDGGDRGARRRARLPAGAAGRARPVGDRRDARRDAVAAVPRLRQRGLPGARRAATALAGAALLALRLQERDHAAGRGGLLPAARHAPVARHEVRAGRDRDRVFACRTLWRSRQRTLALLTAELALFSVIFYVTLNEALYDGPTPYSADFEGETATDASFPGGYLNARTGSSRS